MNFKKLLADTKSLFSMEENPIEKKQKSISNNLILSLMKDSFLKTIEKESMSGRRMLYDTSFLILMHPDDYADRELALPVVTQEIVNLFYELIEARSKEYKNFLPMGKYWYFQFSPSEKFNDIGISIGQPEIFGTLASVKGWNEISGQQLRVSKIANNSKYDRFDVNPEIFKNIDVFARGVFRIKINSELTHLASVPKPEGQGYATLEYIVNAVKYTYLMIEAEIIITRKTDSTPDTTNILAIDIKGQGLEKEHARIKYKDDSNTFEISAFYDNVIVNQKQIPLFPHVEILPKEASIMLGWFNVKFKRSI